MLLEARARVAVSFPATLLLCGYSKGFLKKRKNLARRTGCDIPATVGHEAVTDDFGLLLKPIVLEPPAGLQLVLVTAERMAHQRQVETTALLRLPHVREFVHEEALPA